MFTTFQQPCKYLLPSQFTSVKNRCATIAHRSIRDDSQPERDFMTNRDNLHDEEPVRPADLLTFAWQIAKGMV